MASRVALTFIAISLLGMVSLALGLAFYFRAQWAWAHWEPEMESLAALLPPGDLNFDKNEDKIFHEFEVLHKSYELIIWPINVISALIAFLGVRGTQESMQVIKRLNGTWYFVSTISQNKRITRVSRGQISFRSLEKAGKRPAASLAKGMIIQVHGQTPVDGAFEADSIVIGNVHPYCIYLEWNYVQNNTRALTKIITAAGDFNKKRPTTVKGIFVLHDVAGAGETYYYETDERAEAEYRNFVKEVDKHNSD